MTKDEPHPKDTLLKSLRPMIILDINNSIPQEAFQNQTLRPIIKMQHDIIIKLILKEPHFQSVLRTSEDSKRFHDGIMLFIKKNQNIKNLLIGLIIGMFTQEELVHYLDMKTDLNRRIINIIGKRIADTLNTHIPTL